MVPHGAFARRPRFHGTDHHCRFKETAVSNSKVDTAQGKPVEKIPLLDCGQASKVTKGMPFVILFELAPPPFDRSLLL
jgi:hypothetical protein